MKNRIQLLFCLLLFPILGAGQKMRIITKEDYPIFFDYANPFSLVTILTNNQEIIPSLIKENEYSGVYSQYMLNDMGFDSKEFTSFTSWTDFIIYSPEFESEWLLFKTAQTKEDYLDSISTNREYDLITKMNKEVFARSWDHANEFSYLKLPFDYYFDVQHIVAFILEEKNDQIWVHFVSTIQGKNVIGLSLLKEQVANGDNFAFWTKLDESTSNLVNDHFHKLALEAYELNKDSDYQGTNYCDYNKYSFNSYRRNDEYYMNAYELSLNTVSPNVGLLMNTQEDAKGLTIITSTQKLGDTIKLYEWWYDNTTFPLYKSTENWYEFMDSIDYIINEGGLFVEETLLHESFLNTPLNEPLRLPKKSNIYWVESNDQRIYVSFCVNDELKNKRVMVNQFCFTHQGLNGIESHMQYFNTQNEIYPAFPLALPSEVTSIMACLKQFDHLKLKRIDFKTVHQTLKLSNHQLTF
jgi:hypothetical protein